MTADLAIAVALGLGAGGAVVSLVLAIRRSATAGPVAVPAAGIDQRELVAALRAETREMNGSQLDAIRELVDRRARLGAPSAADASIERTIAELAHSLGTPLAAIKAAAVELGADDPGRVHARRIHDSANLCQAFLLAYRSVGRLNEKVDNLVDSSLHTLVESAAAMYGAAHGRRVTSEVSLPPALEPFPTMQVAAAILPLVENAVEHSRDGLVVVRHSTDDDRVLVVVENAYVGELPPDFDRDGGTSKTAAGHGLGIGVAERLAGSLAGRLRFDTADRTFRALLEFPRLE